MSTNILPTTVVRLYRIWTSIKYRCQVPSNKQFKNYGGRGIFLCKEWEDFNQFCEDMGRGWAEGLHLDRKDNDQGYFKENCRWTTPKVNHRNKRNNCYYETHMGKMCQSELIETIGYTRKQFQRAIEKYGKSEFLKLFKESRLPTKRIVNDMNRFIGHKVGRLHIISLQRRKNNNNSYKCKCECGNLCMKSRFKILHRISLECRSCSKKKKFK